MLKEILGQYSPFKIAGMCFYATIGAALLWAYCMFFL